MKVDTDYNDHTAAVTFDDQKTSVEAMKKALAKEHFPVEGGEKLIK